MAKSRSIQLIISAKDRASKIIKSIGSGVAKFGKMSLAVFGGLTAGVGAVAAGLTYLYKKLAEQIDQQAKMAAALGISNESLGVYRDAAGYAGISTENLNTALRKMSQGVADAANGTGEARDALGELGLDAEKLRAAGPEAAFEAIIERLDEIPNGIKKTGLAMDIFGRSGAAMANLTARGLKESQKAADDLGLKLTTAQAAGVEAANDAWAKIKNAANDFLQFIAATLAPGIKKGFDSAFEFLRGQDLKKWAAGTALAIANAFKNTVVVLGAVAEGIIAITRGMVEAFKVANEVVRKYSNLNYKASAGSVAIAENNLKNLREQGVPEDNYYYKQAAETLAKEKEKANLYLEMAYQAEAIKESLIEAGQALAGAQGASQSSSANKAVKELEKIIDGLNEKTEETGKSSEQSAEKVKGSAEAMAKQYGFAKDQVDGLRGVLERLSSKTWEVNVKVNRYGDDGIEKLEKDLERGEEI